MRHPRNSSRIPAAQLRPRWTPIRRAVGVGLLCSSLLACSSLRSQYQPLTIRVNEPEARVLVRGADVGLAPTTLSVRRDRPLLIQVEKPGFQAVQRTLQVRYSFTGYLDLFGSFVLLFPALGLLSPGAYRLEESEVLFELRPLARGSDGAR